MYPVEINNLFFRYGQNEKNIINGISLRISEGEIYSILGLSGCGKSTLLNLIGGLDTPTTGTIRIGDYEVGSLDEEGLTEYRRRVLGFIFQFHYLLKEFTALENVMMPMLGAAGFATEAMGLRAETLLDSVGPSRWKDNPAGFLSGGQQQRVAIARPRARDGTGPAARR